MRFSRGVEAFLSVLRNKNSCGDQKAAVEELESRRLLSVTASITGNSSVNEGQTYTLTLAGTATSPTPTKDHWTVNWGQGSPQTISGSATTATHFYADGTTTPQISASLIASGTGTFGTTYATSSVATKNVTVNDVTLTGSVWAVNTAYEHNTFTLSRSYSDVAADPATKWVIDWGDGSGSTHGSFFGEEITGNPSTFKHVYASGGNYTVAAVAYNKDESSGHALNSFSLTVHDLEYVVAIDDNGGIMSENFGTLDFTLRRTLPAGQVETDRYSIYVHVKASGIEDEILNSADDSDYSVVMNDNIEDEGDGFYKVTFDPNEDTATLSIMGTDDSDVETQEWFKVVITSVDASGHTPSVDTLHSQSFGGIEDDDQVVSIAVDDGLASEDGNTGKFVVTRGPDSSAALDVPIVFSGAAVKGTDYTTSLSGGSSPYVHFAADATQVVFSITPIDDATAEDPEDVIATLGAPGADDVYTVNQWATSATATITDEPPEAPAAPTDVTAVAMSRSDVQLAWKLPGGGGYPDGFVIQVSTDDGETFAPYQSIYDPTQRDADVSGLDPETDYEFRVDAVIDDKDGWWGNDEDDVTTEGDDTASATTTSDQWIDLGSVTPDMTLHDDQFDIAWFGDGAAYPAGQYRMVYDGGAYNMGSDSYKWCTTYYRYTIQDVDTEDYFEDAIGGGAVSQDSQGDAEYYSWGMGHSFYAENERIGIRFSSSTDSEDPGPGVTWKLERIPEITIQATDDIASEDGDTASFVVDREGDASEELDVPIAFSGGATFGDDYTTDLDGEDEPFVHFDAGESEVTFSITPIEDEVGEDPETVIAMVDPPSGYTAGDPGSATATITDLQIVWITVPDNQMMEPDANDPAMFAINRSSPIGELDVNYILSGTADLGDDYVIDGDPEEHTVHFAEGVQTANVPLTPLADNLVEGTETANPSVDTGQTGCATSDGLSEAAQAAMPVAGAIDLIDNNSHDENYVDLDLQDVPDDIEDTVGGYIPLNADNDNRSGVDSFHIPDHYDFQLDGSQYEGDENDLLRLTLAIPGSFEPNVGNVTLSWSTTGAGDIKVWEEMSKMTAVTNSQLFTLAGSSITVYVEGIHESNALKEITFTLSDGENSDTVIATVVPVLDAFVTTARYVPFYDAAIDSIRILSEGRSKPPPQTFVMTATSTVAPPLKGKLNIAQTFYFANELTGGFGAVMSNPVAKKKVQFPGSLAGKTLFDYKTPAIFPAMDNKSNTREIATSVDSPELDIEPVVPKSTSGRTTEIDVSYKFTNYAFWQFDDGTIYYLGNSEHDTRFQGSLKAGNNAGDDAIFTAGRLNKNTAGSSFLRSNEKPSPTITNDSNTPEEWVP